MMRLPRVALTGLAAGAMVFSACGNQRSEPAAKPSVEALQLVQQSPASTTQAKSARARFRVTYDGVQFRKDQEPLDGSVTAHGVVDFASGSNIRNTVINTRTIGGVVYEKIPSHLRGGMKVATPWVSVDANVLAATGSTDLAGIGSVQQSDPAWTLEYLAGASQSIKQHGTDTLYGEVMSVYDVTIDARKSLAAAPPAERAILQKQLDAIGFTTFDATVWIDDAGRMRQLKYRVDWAEFESERALKGAFKGTSTIVYELDDFGVPVTVEPPNASEVPT